MGDYRNKATKTKGSHNNHSNNGKNNNEKIDYTPTSHQSIHVMKSDTYNIVLTLVAILVILFSIGASAYTMQICNQKISALEDKIEKGVK